MIWDRITFGLGLVVATICTLSCGDSDSGGSSPQLVCEPGQQIPCACPAGHWGAQVCKPSGMGWQPCEGCGGAAGVAGTAGHPGSDASAGSGGTLQGGSAGQGGNPDASLQEGGKDVACDQTNGGVEQCDGVDNNCNGEVDETFDLSSDPHNCGKCNADCTMKFFAVEAVLCSATVGEVGVCDYTTCVEDYWDLDGNRSNGCEFYCVKKSDGDTTCDNIDDNCNGKFDDDVNTCTDAKNCGKCGRNCTGHAHATGECITSDPPPAECDPFNSHCEIASCDAGWVDANGLFNDGCEYACTRTKRTDPSNPSTLVQCELSEPGCGVEYCDGLDNDCNGDIDDPAPPQTCD